MNYTELEAKEVRCRKAHRCGWCDQIVERGASAFYRAYIWEDGPQSDWMHPECKTAMDACDDDLSEGWTPGDFPRGGSVNIHT